MTRRSTARMLAKLTCAAKPGARPPFAIESWTFDRDFMPASIFQCKSDCGRRYELGWIKPRFASQGRAPDCQECGGCIKTATISFGQAMPEAAMRRAEELTRTCDLFVAIGSSLVVWPAAGFPAMAKRNGARLAILNREPTELDAMADLVIHDDIGNVLSCFMSQ